MCPPQDEVYDYCMKNRTYPAPEYKSPISLRVLWSLRLTMLFWMTVLVVLPCVFITVFLSWGYLLFLLFITILCESTPTNVGSKSS